MTMPRLFCLLSTALLAPGCITPDDLEEVPPDTPITLHRAASELLGRHTEAVLVETENTLADFPLEAQRIRNVSRRASEAVVSVFVKTSTAARLRLLPFRIPGTGFRVSIPGEGLGSGFFIHPSGYILTNHHVIRDATDIFVQTSTGEDYGVTVLAEDPVYDLALLKVRAGGVEFAALPIGRSELMDVGEMVIAVGNPLGLGHTVTQGIISQTGRNLARVEVEGGRQIDYLQTDTAINPGSSGGPLITLTGAWIGVNTAGYTQAQGISFAVPSRQAREFLINVLAGNGVRLP
jgi:S1-C subfamily serine protease